MMKKPRTPPKKLFARRHELLDKQLNKIPWTPEEVLEIKHIRKVLYAWQRRSYGPVLKELKQELKKARRVQKVTQ